uniref:Odorant receptor n=1 Tax=Streltzoviella insularis TaxID=1206366 RepID=A0A7D5UMN7_9NEOP|nr:odorant receptor 53 [Streltzoviella insularis]
MDKKENIRIFTGNLLNFLEIPNHPCIGPHLKLLGLTGLWHPNKNSPVTKFKRILFYVTVTFFCSQYIKCLFNIDVISLALILQYAPFHMGIVKSCYFQRHYKKWERLIIYMSSVECAQLADRRTDLIPIMNGYIKKSRRVTYFFWALAFFSNFAIFSEPYQKNHVMENSTAVYTKIFDGIAPFNQEKPPGYYVSMVLQTIFGHIVSAYVVAWDTLIVSIMVFFSGQLKVSRWYFVQVIDVNSIEKSHQNIVKCHHFYTTLVSYQKMFNSLISPVMFIYLIIISVNLGVCIIEIAQLQDDIVTLVSSCLFVLACIIQLLIFYWYANEVTEVNNLVGYGIFESEWMQLDKSLQKEIALLGLITTKKIVFKAGPLNEMSLSTFVGILRTSYSFYTLLSKTKN